MDFIIYNEATGRIGKAVRCPPEIIHLNCPEGHTWIEGAQVDDTGFYVVDGAVVERPGFSVTTSGALISGVPEGATITIEGETYTADGDDIEFEPTISGTYAIGLSLFPFKDTTIEVTV